MFIAQSGSYREENPQPEISMADNRTMAELLQAPIEVYEDAIVIPEITANNFELRHGTSSSTLSISSDVAELKDMVKALLLDKKNQSLAPTPSTTPAPVKVVEPSCAAATSYNQGNIGFRPQMVANQIRPPEFPPHQNNQNNFNRGNNFNQNQGRNFNQSNFNPSSFNQGQLHRPRVNQAPVYQAPIPQTQRVSQINFESYVKANDAILRNMQSQGTLPGNTITNPKEDLKGITTRSGVAYQGPKTPSPSKQGTKPVVAPVSAPMPNSKPFIPYPSRRNDEKRHDQANEQIEKFYEIFKDMSFEISFTDALTLMPKFALTLKALIRNKEKLNEIARTPINEHCSAVILNNLPRKLRDPRKFLIPCEFPGMDECLALADLGTSINLMLFSVWEALSLPELTLTCMTLELRIDRSLNQSVSLKMCYLKLVCSSSLPTLWS
uniref:Reverse transcriptase domain-containing protein n=1 Tax=Tanacetum cinerariifolium TaxID=118510 RepID=A0A699K2L7_TANCI|nr:reverse transcriptase domain-containing protein [Tanacetum cinerariifolium]